MGETYIIVNPAKRQYIDIGDFNENSKASGLMRHRHACAVSALVCCLDNVRFESGEPRHSFGSLAGAWCGDRLYVVGDMTGEPNEFGLRTTSEDQPERNLYGLAREEFDNITNQAISMLVSGIPELADEMVDQAKTYDSPWDFVRLGDVAILENCAPMAEALARGFGDRWQRRYEELWPKYSS